MSYLLRELLLFAIALLALLFMGGIWHRPKPGTATHASLLGLGIGALLASIAFLATT